MEGQREKDGLVEVTEPIPAGKYANEDITPTNLAHRTWNWMHIAALWVGMSVCIPTYMLASGMIASGLTWRQAVMTILLGNIIVLIPMALNAWPGTQYGIPFPVLVRSSFGLAGAHIPSISRALVACGWFGIQTWVGGKAIYRLIEVFQPGIANIGPGLAQTFIGINGGEFLCFMLFWALHMWIVHKGTESIKWLESWSAPILIIIGLWLIVWAHQSGGGLGNVLNFSSRFSEPSIRAVLSSDRPGVLGEDVKLHLNVLSDNGRPRATEYRLSTVKDELPHQSWRPFQPVTHMGPNAKMVYVEIRDDAGNMAKLEAAPARPASASAGPAGSWWLTVFLPLLTAMVGYWATLSLNIPDFTRYARSQKDQIIGQAVGLPTTMTLYAFVGIVATCASIVVFKDILIPEQAPWDPVDLLAHFKSPVMLAVSMFFLAIATLTTNIAANVVAPANSISNLAPSKISFECGGYITGVIGILMMPWLLLKNAAAYIFTWLIGYSALMGGVAGVMISDFYIRRKRRLVLKDLYRDGGIYPKVNWAGIIAFVLGLLPSLPGFLHQLGVLTTFPRLETFDLIYKYAWFVSFLISLVVYWLLTLNKPAEQA